MDICLAKCKKISFSTIQQAEKVPEIENQSLRTAGLGRDFTAEIPTLWATGYCQNKVVLFFG